jgi:hypothetical protein
MPPSVAAKTCLTSLSAVYIHRFAALSIRQSACRCKGAHKQPRCAISFRCHSVRSHVEDRWKVLIRHPTKRQRAPPRTQRNSTSHQACQVSSADFAPFLTRDQAKPVMHRRSLLKSGLSASVRFFFAFLGLSECYGDVSTTSDYSLDTSRKQRKNASIRLGASNADLSQKSP